MSERWALVKSADGTPVSVGTVVADDAEARGLVVEWVDINDGQIPTITDGRLVGTVPATVEPSASLEERLAAVERVVSGEAPRLDAARGR